MKRAAQVTMFAGAGFGLAAGAYLKRRGMASLRDQVVLITGSSRGLGLALACEFASHGARLVICGRRMDSLELAEQKLTAAGADVLALPCDVSKQEQVEYLVERAIDYFGRIDILVNNAGIITVGPQQTMTLQDYRACMDIMFWGTVYATLAVLPHMQERKSGQVVNITSIGGKVSVPHLLPYSCAKFAALGFSQGLHAELVKSGIKVTTVVPGLMRTGSHINALFKGKHRQEYALFAPLATLPLSAISASRAARQIVQATRRGTSELIISIQAQLLARFHGLLPGTTSTILGQVARLLPDAGEAERQAWTGDASRSELADRLARPGEPAARAYNQYVPSETEDPSAFHQRERRRE